MSDSDQTQQARATHEAVHLVPYDADWPLRFEQERARLMALFPTLLAVEHFGSTAVPGMPAKPIIDIIAGVASMADADLLFEPILANGYTTSRAFNEMLLDRKWFMRAANGHRTHHLHVVVHGGPVWVDKLRFRDLLRGNVDLARAYAQCKADLALRYRHDREAYTEAKDPFIAVALATVSENFFGFP